MFKINFYYSLFIAIVLFSNNCPPLFSAIGPLQKTCKGLGIYYKQRGRKDYYDDNGIGLFTKWFNDQEMEIEDMDEELQDGNEEDCSYLDFDDNFPFKNRVYDEKQKQKEMFKIIQKCHKYGRPEYNASQTNKSVTINAYWKKMTSEKLIDAIRDHKLEIVQYWQAEGMLSEKVYHEGKNALHLACKYGHLEIIKFLLDVCGFGLEAKSKDRHLDRATPLFYAIHMVMDGSKDEDNQLEVCKYLKKRGAKVEKTDQHGDNVLHHACFCAKPKIVRWLLDDCGFKAKSKIEAKGGKCKSTPFLYAVSNISSYEIPYGLEIAKMLVKEGVNIKAKDIFGNNALSLAKHYLLRCPEKEEMINYLQSLGIRYIPPNFTRKSVEINLT